MIRRAATAVLTVVGLVALMAVPEESADTGALALRLWGSKVLAGACVWGLWRLERRKGGGAA